MGRRARDRAGARSVDEQRLVDLLTASLVERPLICPAVLAESPDQRGFPQSAPIHFGDALARFVRVHVTGLRHV